MKKLTFEEKMEITAALQARIEAMKDCIATRKLLGFDTSYYETYLSLYQTINKTIELWLKIIG